MDTLGPRIIDIPHADMVLTFDKRQLLGFVCSSSTSMVLPFHLFFKIFVQFRMFSLGMAYEVGSVK